MSSLYRVVEVHSNSVDPTKPAMKKDIGLPWTTIKDARIQMKGLKEKNPGVSYGLEMK
jgi:hypothetical protein